jgi:hypothetical protein
LSWFQSTPAPRKFCSPLAKVFSPEPLPNTVFRVFVQENKV